MSDRPTRRQLLAGGVGTAAGLSAIGPAVAWADSGHQAQDSPKVQDGKTIQQLLYNERLLIYGYQHALGTGFLNHDARALVLLQLVDEEAHVAALKAHQSALNVPSKSVVAPKRQHPLPFPPQAVTDLFNAARHEQDALQVIVQIESVAESGYFVAAAEFHDPQLVRLAAEILACEAQHWTMLVDLLHQGDATQAVPHPTVRGSMHIGTPHKET
jgi:Ferritin-like domain